VSIYESTTYRWVSALKSAYPHLPDSLSIDVEKANLAVLKDWFARVQALRIEYDQMDKSELPEELQDETGKRQIIPVLLSLDSMSPQEIQAWHELFVCLSAHMADIAYTYWRTHASSGSAVSLEDVLNYLPVVFLYVLSSYKEYPQGAPTDEENREDFSHADDGRVRLITWVHIEARRHINTYLQHYAYTVRYGSGYTHRLRQTITKLQAKSLTSEGRTLTKDEVVTEVRKTHYGQIVSASTLADHVGDVMTSESTVSLSDPMGSGSDTTGSPTFEDILSSHDVDIQHDVYDPCSWLEERVAPVGALRDAVSKVLYGGAPLTFSELAFLGT
jgi:hypothetical protein